MVASTAIPFDLNNAAVIDDPYPYYTWLRDEAPVYHSISPDLWILSRYDDVVTALRDSSRFSSDPDQATDFSDNPFNPGTRVPRRLVKLADRLPVQTLLTSDAPYHTRLRKKVSRAFTPRQIALWEPRIREIAERLVDEVIAGSGDVDLVHRLTSPLPTMVIADMMGIPARQHSRFKRWSDNLVNGLLTGGSTFRMLTSAVSIALFFARTVRDRRRHPGDDLISLLVTPDAGGEKLTLFELISFCILLLVAGNETTTNLITNTVLALLDRPSLWRQLTADPELITAAIDETLRYDGPGQGLLRITKCDVTIHEVTIPAGARVLPLIGSANRDPRHWADPDEFRLDRNTNDHIAFGVGIHYCLGNALARIEAGAALHALAERAPHLLRSGTPERIQSPVLRGLRTLPIRIAT